VSHDDRYFAAVFLMSGFVTLADFVLDGALELRV
jgi:hypothetical protein